MAPAKYQKALEYLKDAGVSAAVSGVLVGRPMDGVGRRNMSSCCGR